MHPFANSKIGKRKLKKKTVSFCHWSVNVKGYSVLFYLYFFSIFFFLKSIKKHKKHQGVNLVHKNVLSNFWWVLHTIFFMTFFCECPSFFFILFSFLYPITKYNVTNQINILKIMLKIIRFYCDNFLRAREKTVDQRLEEIK